LEERIERSLGRLDMARHADLAVGAMSRGMIQRVALSRATLHEPALLLLDEPDTGLDARAYDALSGLVHERATDRAVVMASHDLGRVLDLADEVAFVRNGRLVETLPTQSVTLAQLQDRYADVLARPLARRQPAETTPRSA
jgi:ABC-type multidrug transport system ATPase subunit